MLTPVYNTYRNAYSGLSRPTWILSLVMLINRSGTMVVPFMTLYLTSPSMGYSIAQAGTVFSLFGLGAFSGAYLGGRMTDKIGFFSVQIFTLVGGGILFFVLSQMKSYSLICLVTYLLSFVNEAFRPANSTAIAFYSKEENRTRSYALNRLAINLGWAVGSGMGGFLAKINYELLFWVDGATNIAAAILIWTFLKPVKPDKKTVTTEKTIAVSAFRDKHFMIFILLTTLFASCFFQLFTNMPVFFKNGLEFSEPVIGLLLATNGIIIAVIEMVLIYKLEGKRNNLYYISIGVVLVGIAFLMLIIPGMGLLLAFMMIITVTFGEILSMPFMNSFWISRTQTGNRGQYAALYTMAWSAAQTLGPFLGAQIADRHGFYWLWITVGSVSILAAFSFRWLKSYI